MNGQELVVHHIHEHECSCSCHNSRSIQRTNNPKPVRRQEETDGGKLAAGLVGAGIGFFLAIFLASLGDH